MIRKDQISDLKILTFQVIVADFVDAKLNVLFAEPVADRREKISLNP